MNAYYRATLQQNKYPLNGACLTKKVLYKYSIKVYSDEKTLEPVQSKSYGSSRD